VSLRYEQYRALLYTRDFMRDLLTVEAYPKTKREMRERARACLRHFPLLYESGQPIWSRDDLTKDCLPFSKQTAKGQTDDGT
jgi:hypothetical protein